MLVADLSATSWCDRAGRDALIRAYQLAAVSQAELRLVVTGAAVGRLVADAGLDMLVAVFGSIEAAVAAPGPDGDAARAAAALQAGLSPWSPQAGRASASGLAVPNAALLLQLIDTLDDGIMLADDGTIVLASRRLTAMVGYQDGELTGQLGGDAGAGGAAGEHRKDRASWARAAPVACHLSVSTATPPRCASSRHWTCTSFDSPGTGQAGPTLASPSRHATCDARASAVPPVSADSRSDAAVKLACTLTSSLTNIPAAHHERSCLSEAIGPGFPYRTSRRPAWAGPV